MSVAKLNVEIAARLNNLNGGLKEAERQLADFAKKVRAAEAKAAFSPSAQIDKIGAQMQGLGEKIALAAGAPIAGLMAASIKAAGDFEGLRNAIVATMTDAGRSTVDAEAHLEELRKAALAPGLDFEQAVRGSIRLQGVGYSAEQAKKILVELANAISLTGGTAEDLDGVTRQFTQMVSKGRVLMEDLSVISERLPKIGALSKAAFGTSNAEELRAKGIDAQKFVAGITAEMEKLKRVEGGISNSIVNAGSALKQFLGRIGDEINRAFNLSKMSDQFSAWLGRMGDAFASLDAPTKRTIVTMAAVVVAVGPVIKVIGMVTSAVGGMVAFGGQVVAWGRAVSTAVSAASAAFQALNLTTRSLLIAGGIIALGLAIGGVIAYLANMRKETTAAEHAAQALAEVQGRAGQIMAAEKVEAEKLVKTLTSETKTRAQKEDALRRLQAINSDYFGQLSVEKSSIEDINASLRGYIELIGKRAKLQAANEKLVEVEKELADEQIRLENAQPGWVDKATNALLSMGNATQYAALNAQTLGKNFKDTEAALNAKKEALIKTIAELEGQGIAATNSASATNLFGAALNKSSAGAVENAAAVKKAKEMSKAYADVLQDIAGAKEAGKIFDDTYERTADALAKGIEKLTDAGFSASSQEVQGLLQQINELKASLGSFGSLPIPKISDLFKDGEGNRTINFTPVVSQTAKPPEISPEVTKPVDIDLTTEAMKRQIEYAGELRKIQAELASGAKTFGEAFAATAEAVAQNGTVIQQTAFAMASAMDDVASKGSTSFAELGKAALKGAADVVRAWIRQGVAAAVSKALQFLPFPINLAAGAAAGAGASILFNKALAALKIPALAKGGILSGASLVLAGEYPSASQGNPEVVAPLRELPRLLGGMGNTVVVGGDIRFDGRDLVLALKAGERKMGRG